MPIADKNVLRLSTDGRYSVTNGKIRMRVFLFCRVDILSLSLISERVRLQFMFSWPEQRATPLPSEIQLGAAN